VNLSKIDCLNKKFPRRPMGYAVQEVDQFLGEIAEVLGEYADMKKELVRRIKRLEAQLTEYKQRDETLRDTLMSTQKMVDELKVSAGREAELILDEAHGRAEEVLRDARGKADDTLRDAHTRLAKVSEEIESLRRQRNQFRVQIKGVIQSHLSMLEPDEADVKAEEQESKLTYLKKAT
jgi:cell division initiation protein